jgi:hypothetical protein
MHTVLHRKSPSTESRRPDSARGVEMLEKHSLAIMGFFITTGLLSVLADAFTNTVSMLNGLRDFGSLFVSLPSVLWWPGFTLFFLSYKTSKPGNR